MALMRETDGPATDVRRSVEPENKVSMAQERV